MLCFTNFIPDNMTVFILGYQFVAMMGFVFMVNIGLMIENNVSKYFKKKKKEVIQ